MLFFNGNDGSKIENIISNNLIQTNDILELKRKAILEFNINCAHHNCFNCSGIAPIFRKIIISSTTIKVEAISVYLG